MVGEMKKILATLPKAAAATEEVAEPEAEEEAAPETEEEPAAVEEEAEKNPLKGIVSSLTSDNFKSTIDSVDVAVVKFFAPWCGHCKSMAPGYIAAAKQLEEEDINGYVFEVDCTVQKELCGEYGVRGYPTLKTFVKGNAEDYKGGRQQSEVIRSIKKSIESMPQAPPVAAKDEL
jgi:protein disulfide-isomerase A1